MSENLPDKAAPRQIGDPLYETTVLDTRDFLVKKDQANWDKLDEVSKAELLDHAYTVAHKIVRAALELIGDKSLAIAIEDGSLAQAIVEFLPMPKFKIRVVLNDKEINPDDYLEI
ncbi:MAG: hypothetical protein JWO78_181 [Micavibrio sp.]|nr:hypothetical protein [Micavibrio sp.]